MDGDTEFPTINGTGTEDYFYGSYDFENQATHQYEEFTCPYSGLIQVLKPDGLYHSQPRFGLYRWHIPDPIRFTSDLRVTFRHLPGEVAEGTYRSWTIFPLWLSGIRPNRTRRFRNCRDGMN